MTLLQKMLREDKIDVFLPQSTFKSTPATKLRLSNLRDIENNLSVVGNIVNHLSAKALALTLIDILSYALPRTPVDTGELRESAIATIKPGRYTTLTIGGGKADGSIFYHPLGHLTQSKFKGVRTLRGDISYNKIDEHGVDVALWTHEYLNPFSSGKTPQARTPGTGPHYLSSAYDERIGAAQHLFDEYVTGDNLTKALRSVTKQRPGTYKKGKYTVPEVILARYSK